MASVQVNAREGGVKWIVGNARKPDKVMTKSKKLEREGGIGALETTFHAAPRPHSLPTEHNVARVARTE